MSAREALGEFTVELGQERIAGQRWASIKFGDSAVFTELVSDSQDHPAEQNIRRLFADRLRRVLEGE